GGGGVAAAVEGVGDEEGFRADLVEAGAHRVAGFSAEGVAGGVYRQVLGLDGSAEFGCLAGEFGGLGRERGGLPGFDLGDGEVLAHRGVTPARAPARASSCCWKVMTAATVLPLSSARAVPTAAIALSARRA